MWSVAAGEEAVGTAGYSAALELRDALGAAVPVTRLDLWIADPAHLLVFAQFDPAGAPVGAPVRPLPTRGSDAHDG